jgi:cardiolipin synthase
VFIYDGMTAAGMRDIYLEDEEHSVLFTDIPQRIHPRFLKRLGESLARMLSPLM